MHGVDIRNISIGQIQIFLKVVEFNSFTKAAAHMHLAQSTVSKSVISLESMLELQLFIRDKTKIHLTPAGRLLYNKWNNIAAEAENAICEAHILQTGRQRSITVAGLDSYNPHMVILPVINYFKYRHPNISITVETMPAEEVRSSLINGDTDIAFTVLYDIEQLGFDDFEAKELATCPHCACMLKKNPLSDRKTLKVEDLKLSDFISISPLKTPSYSTAVEQLCREHGFVPNITHYTQGASSLAFNLLTENDVFICDRFFKDFDNPAISAVPLENTKSGIVIGWKKTNQKPEVAAFIRETLNFISEYPI